MNRHEVDSVSWKNTTLGSIGKPRMIRIVIEFYEIGKKAASICEVQKGADESDGVHRRVLDADSLCFFQVTWSDKTTKHKTLCHRQLKTPYYTW